MPVYRGFKLFPKPLYVVVKYDYNGCCKCTYRGVAALLEALKSAHEWARTTARLKAGPLLWPIAYMYYLAEKIAEYVETYTYVTTLCPPYEHKKWCRC